MKRPDQHVAAIQKDIRNLPVGEGIPYLRDVIVPLVENLGYELARLPDVSVAPSAFVFSNDLDKRFRWLESTTRSALSP
ncbi:hypothetical protein [Maliponia aquimaris]|uniref:Uncharacterized protein n=1 Tax=Maliponia aquimaris TaxID=1673631 RepID=A0A238KPN4_9RHOB|nr:hypothetical protein [Maliponia aquimaris]SMX44698.1 hypothetical protein MAA8898_03037 [Maliponia aquimaris]